MVVHFIFAVFGLLGIVDGIEVIRSYHKKRGWITLIAGILIILISAEQCIIYLFFDWPSTGVAVWTSRFMYNITYFILGIMFLFIGINLIKAGGSFKKMRGILGVFGGSLMILFSFLEILFR